MTDNVQRPFRGLHMDSSPGDQPKETYRYALNAVLSTGVGDKNFVSTEKGNLPSVNLTEGFVPIGHVYATDDAFIVWSVNPVNNISEIGIVTKDHKYKPVVNTSRLGFSINHQIDATFRVRRGSEWVAYWTDNNEQPMSFNFGRTRDYYTQEYIEWIDSHNGDDSGYAGEKWDESKFSLIQEYSKIPIFKNVVVRPSGNLLAGSYSFGIFYVDENTNSTECINTCEPVNIYADDTTKQFHNIRGSNNNNTEYEAFGKCNKSIHVTFSNLDTSFQYYKVAIIKATSGDGTVNEVLLSNLISTQNPTFVYYGQDTQFQAIALSDVANFANRIAKVGSIEQLENRLLLGNIQNKVVDWLNFQRYASKITNKLILKEVVLNYINDTHNPKNPSGPYNGVGYMPGEVYSFGIIYVFKDGSISPAFHIPGNNESYGGLSNGMSSYQCQSVYPKIHKNDIADYWGDDFLGNPLEGTPIRHHRFPFRDEIDIPLVEENKSGGVIKTNYLNMTIILKAGKEFPSDETSIDFHVGYMIDGTTTPIYDSITITKSSLGGNIRVYENLDGTDNLKQNWTDGTYTAINYGVSNIETVNTNKYAGLFDVVFNYSSSGITLSEIYKSQMMGIEFGNVQMPHPDVIGYYIVRNESVDSDRIIIDNAIMNGIPHINTKKGPDGEVIEGVDIYHAFGMWNFNPMGTNLPNSNEQAWKLADWAYIYSLEHQFNSTLVSFEAIRRNSYYSIYPKLYGTKYINDVYPGTSFNNEAHSGKDSDGFDLALRWRDNGCIYEYDKIGIPIKELKADDIYYLSAGAYTQVDKQIIYNTSTDNKICMVHLTEEFEELREIDKIQYVSLVNKPVDAYADFISRTYYKEHNNLIYIANSWSATMTYRKDDTVLYNNKIYIALRENTNIIPSDLDEVYWDMIQNNDISNHKQIFHGDAYVAPINPVSSMLYDLKAAHRKYKKKSWWEYVVGAISIVAGVVLTIVSVGTLAAAGVGLIAVGIGFIAAGIMSGMRLEALQEMVAVHYKTGLRSTVQDIDSNSYECDYVDGNDSVPSGCKHAEDDTICWFHDKLTNVFIESRLNIYLRNGYTIGCSDFMDAPYSSGGDTSIKKLNPLETQGAGQEMSNYLINKMTAIDRENNDGKSYRGFAMAEVYALNKDYMRENHEKMFYHLPMEYSINRNDPEHFTHRIHYSEQSYQEELMDNYKVFLPNNYRDIEGEFGEITDLLRKDNKLYIFTRESFWYLPQNLQQQVTSDLITVIGTGEFFAINPQRILDDKNGGGGTSHKWATILNRNGIFYASEIEGKVYIFDNQLREISLQGLEMWMKENLHIEFNKQWYNAFGENYRYINNPANNIGIVAVYDNLLDRYIITKRDYKYLGDWSNIIKDVDSAQDYPNGTIIIGDDGDLEVVTGIEYVDVGVVNFSSWETTEYMNLNLGLLEPSDKDHQIITQYGRIYQDGVDLIYTANDYDNLDFNGAEYVYDIIDITLGDCGQEQVQFSIKDIPSKACPNGFVAGGQVAYQTTKIVLGRYSGVVKFMVNTYWIPDRFDIYYGDVLTPANLLFSTMNLPDKCKTSDGLFSTTTGGEGTEKGLRELDEFKYYRPCSTDKISAGVAIKFNYVVKNPEIQHVTLVTQAPKVGTAWEYEVGCPCTEWGGEPTDPKRPITEWNFCQDCAEPMPKK